MSSNEDGLTAREFFNELLLPDFPGGLKDPKWCSQQPQHAAFNRLTADGMKRLKDGDWYGEGILLPRQSGSKPERIEARLWDALNIHLYDGTVYGHGIEYAGVLFYENRPEPKKTIAGEFSCQKYLVDLMKAKKLQSKPDYRTTALEEFPGLSRKGFDRAWNEALRQPPPVAIDLAAAEVPDGWTREELVAYQAERDEVASNVIAASMANRRRPRHPRWANSKYSPLRWRG